LKKVERLKLKYFLKVGFFISTLFIIRTDTTIMKNFTLIVFALFAFSVFSCQDEEESVVQDTANNFTKTSPIASLISRVSQYETTKDNVLDGTSNCSIKLPVQITVNNQYLNVISQSDFQTIQNIKNQSNSDDDEVTFNYPITIVYPNHQEYVVTNEAMFNGIRNEYSDDSPFREVSCLNFNYPISINLYNINNQIASTVSVQNDIQFYDLIHNLGPAQIAGVVFPITMINSNAAQITINNKSYLEEVINNAINSCNTSPSPISFPDVLTSGSWYVSYFYDDSDETIQYAGYNFTFNDNESVIAVKNANSIEGDWDIDSGTPQQLDLHFDGSQLHDLETDWDLQEFTATYIRLRCESSGSGSGTQNYSYLSFTKN
jgi:hypothetical protein